MTRGGDASSGGEKEVHSPSICFSLSSIPTGFVLSSVQCRLPPTFPLFPVYDDPMPTKGRVRNHQRRGNMRMQLYFNFFV
ncbi:hypothetical protein ACS0TY_023964 [Phlomoides rotata]